MRVIDAATVEAAVGWPAAVAALRTALAGGLDPEHEPPRTAMSFGAGQLLTMPSSGLLVDGRRLAGVKLATVAPDNPAAGLPRISATYTVFDAGTLVPLAVLDGTALTALRTPAVSALGVDLLAPAAAHRLVVFGTGPQALGHVHALRAVRPIDSVAVVGRSPQRAAPFVRALQAAGVDAQLTGPDAVADADLVACCTSARTPLFRGEDLSPHAVVVACGSHEPAAREVDTETVRRCGIAVESVTAAWREAGDLVLAAADGAVGAEDVVALADLVRGATDKRPQLVKTVGMGWEDLAVAAAVLAAVPEETAA